jgi:hypothetical protein
MASRQRDMESLCGFCMVDHRYVGYALTTQWEGQEASKLQMIGFDMGGTSTDVSRFAGSYEHVFESTTAGPQQYLRLWYC